MNCIARLALVPLLAVFSGIPTAVAEVPKPVRTLWAGSSSLYFHDMPKVCCQWLTKSASMPAVAEVVGRSGTGAHVYLRPNFKAEYGLKPGQTILEKIAAEKYGYVVLQVLAEFINGEEGEEHDKSLDVYCQAIRAVGGEPVFYEMGWGRDEKADVGRQKIFAAAVRNKVTMFVPCSTAWQRVRRERPELELQDPPDTAHPGTLGCYLNLCCFYATFTGKPTAGLPTEVRIWPHLSEEEKKAAEEKVKTTQFDAYDSSLPGWMKRLVVMSKNLKIPEPTAAYLQRVAEEEYQSAQERLKQAL
jgi:hypothetical protein